MPFFFVLYRTRTCRLRNLFSINIVNAACISLSSLYANNKSFASKRFVTYYPNSCFKAMLKRVFQQQNPYSPSYWFSIHQIKKNLIPERYHPFIFQRHNYHSDKYSPLRDRKRHQPNDRIPRYGHKINHTKNETCVKNGIIWFPRMQSPYWQNQQPDKRYNKRVINVSTEKSPKFFQYFYHLY